MCAPCVKEESSSDEEEFRNGTGNALKHNLKIAALPIVDELMDITPDGSPTDYSKSKARKERKRKHGRKSGSTKDTSHAMDVSDPTTISQHDGTDRGGFRKLKVKNEYTSDESSLSQSSPKKSPKMTFSSE